MASKEVKPRNNGKSGKYGEAQGGRKDTSINLKTRGGVGHCLAPTLKIWGLRGEEKGEEVPSGRKGGFQEEKHKRPERVYQVESRENPTGKGGKGVTSGRAIS